MGWRYCPECEVWLETSEYTVDEMGETVCPDHETPTHGFINQNMTVVELRNSYGIEEKEVQQAKRQGLV